VLVAPNPSVQKIIEMVPLRTLAVIGLCLVLAGTFAVFATFPGTILFFGGYGLPFRSGCIT
jgi:hypothetical protein